MEALHKGALGAIGEVFGDRLKRRRAREGETPPGGALASVFPVSTEEIELLARIAQRYSVPLVALGAETASEARSEEGSILVRFDLMRNLRLPETDESWAEAEPGALWLALDNDLHARGRGLAVYPTSAPRATVGGWVAQDGLGVGSFEYGWLRENVLSADVVMPGGERRTVRGEELRSVVGEEDGGIVVGTTLRTRPAENDVPFALVFRDPEDLSGAVASISRAGVPLWHLAFLNPEMARIRGLGEEQLLFGAYPGERGAVTEEALQEVASSHRGRVLPPTDAYRAWGERFFPVAPARPTPALADRTFIQVTEIAQSLKRRSAKAVQGTVARSGEVLLLAFDAREEGWVP
jgi:FAD/FMN-containing dehydrogenase